MSGFFYNFVVIIKNIKMADKYSLGRINSASNLSKTDRQKEDFYATPSRMVDLLFKYYPEIKSEQYWEPCNGMGHISSVLEKYTRYVRKSDILNRTNDTNILDFLNFDINSDTLPEWLSNMIGKYDNQYLLHANIVTNPPYGKGNEFYEKACSILAPNSQCAMFVKIQFLETQKRYELFKKYPPKKVLICVNRVHCGKDGHFDNNTCSGGAACYCWLIYQNGYTGPCTIDWINTNDDIEAYKKEHEEC
jgi:hypothetical protein